jgi:phosphoribosyl 1,2-cyclic phosphate phosphodiesterase
MRARFLGTAAAEGYPDAFCGCDNCRRARELGGDNLRHRSALLIEDDLLIDLGPDLLAALAAHGIALDRVTYCLQTHEHSDHLHPVNLLARSPFCGVHGAPRLHYYATQGAIEAAGRGLGTGCDLAESEVTDALNLTAHPIAPFQAFAVGPYRARAVLAAHDPALACLLYVVERDGKALFYATDTGPLPEEIWAALTAWGGRFDAVIMDHTFGYGRASTGHLNGEQFLAQVARLRSLGLLANGARIYATHIAHHSNPLHAELVAQAAAAGYLVAHDGLTIAI